MSQPSDTDADVRIEKSLQAAGIGAGAAAALIGGAFLVSWLAGAMASRGLNTFTVKANASFCLLLCGTALVLAVPPHPSRVGAWSARALACVALLTGALTLLEHIFGLDFGIDQLLAEEQVGAFGVLHPNRMGIPSALSFTLCGVGILLLLQGKNWTVPLVQLVGIALSLVASLGLLGHLYLVGKLHPVPLLAGMAWPAALGVLLLGIGLLFARPRESFMATFTDSSPAGMASRRLLVPAIVLPVLLGWLRLQGEIRGLFGIGFGTSLVVISWIAIFSAFVYQVGRKNEAQQKGLENQRAREAIRKSEQRLENIIQNLTEGLILIDPKDGTLQWNRRALLKHHQAQAVDLASAEALARSYQFWTLDGELVPPSQWPVMRVLRGEEIHDVDLVVRDIRRNWQRIFSYGGIMIRDEKGDPQMGVLTFRDVTVRKEAENALRESEEKFRAVFQQSEIGMGRVSFADARWVDVNDALRRMLGYSRDEMLETPWPQITHPEDLELDLIPFREMAAGKLDTYTVEKRFLHKDGHHLWARLTLSLVRDLQGRPDYEIAIIEDVTDRKKAEEALRQAKDELELRVRDRTRELEEAYAALQHATEQRLAAVEDLREKEQLLVQQSRLAAMGEMLANIAHQWRQPLNILGLLVQDLQLTHEVGELSGEALDAEVKTAMGLINHMSQTITDFKDFLKEEKEAKPFSVNKAVIATVSLLEAPLKAMNVEVEIDQRDELVVTGGRNEFSHVIMNLITNARDAFTERRIAAPKIVIRLFRDQGKSVVTVADNAGGIPEEIMDRVFDPYFTTKGPDKGTGIGLYMSRNIVEKSLAGLLTVRNTDEGAEFRIEC